MREIEKTLDEREKTYGNFVEQSRIAQTLKRALYANPDKIFDPDQLEALEMICVKMARIVNGDPNHADSWHDIAGYAMLVACRLDGDDEAI